MKYPGIEDFIKQHLRFQQHWNKKVISMTDAKWQVLEEDTMISNISFGVGSMFKVFETRNFGWIVFHSDARTPCGDVPGRRIFKW